VAADGVEQIQVGPETNAERLENIHSKCLEQIEKYIDAKTEAASARDN
jgi:hypothetical protein